MPIDAKSAPQADRAPDTWEFWVDRGGTFTDVIGRAPDGATHVRKLLSVNQDHYVDAAVEGVRQLLGLVPDDPFPAARVRAIKIGTTVATNALLERRGAPTVFVTTKGFGDTLRIGDQTRPDIFALDIDRPAPLHAFCVEADERLDAWGDVLTPLNADALARDLAQAQEAGAQSAAICFLHAHVDPRHERTAAGIAHALGFAHVSASHECDPLPRFLARARTTVADAYLTPALRAYADGLHAAFAGAPLYFMTSAGGLTAPESVRGRDALLSGPAGGVVGMAATARAIGRSKVIGFDMGGTSTDVSRHDGEGFERVESTFVGGWPVRAPTLAVHTVAAGGGSILTFDGERARVGPHSAGADPGPAAYGMGGPLTVTDANILVGRIDARFFPAVFGPGADRPLNPDVARRRFARLAFDMGAPTPEACADGFLDVAIESIARAVRRVSLAKGYDPAQYALSSFGGAGGQLACRLAEALNIKTVLVNPFASVLSALGVGVADRQAWRERACEAQLDAPGAQAIRDAARQVEREARDSLTRDGAKGVQTRTEARLRYAGSDTALTVATGGANDMHAAFEAAHRRLFGFVEPERLIVCEAVAAEARAPTSSAQTPQAPAPKTRGGPTPVQLNMLFANGVWEPAPVYVFADMRARGLVHGPAVIVSDTSQIVVDRGWRAEREPGGNLIMTRLGSDRRDDAVQPEDAAAEAAPGQTGIPAGDPRPPAPTSAPDPVSLELFNQRFMSVAEEMGVTLERTAHSVNIKERLDFSCAVFDAAGALVANAPHMPVHLGSMSASVRAVIAARPDLKSGDAIALNDPARGGTHLPDVTVVAPVDDQASGQRLFYVAARGHHADIGGLDPGSMPAFSTSLEEEGVVFSDLQILARGQFQDALVRRALAAGKHPARTPDRNIADLKAQLAACARGAAELQRLVAEQGRDRVVAFMGHVQANAEAAVRRVLARLPDGEAQVAMDGDRVIAVRVSVDQDARSAVIDFSGTSPEDAGNFNAPAAIARAAVLYVFRCLAGDDIPLNEGCLTPLTIKTPPQSLLDPSPQAAVVAGNVETSQHIVDALLLATGALAGSQGTMNNLTFGDAARQYYETICGGAGASPRAPGVSGVHTHMTNSRLTDPEILENRLPVLVEAFSLRAGSGGDGHHRGGDGVRRRLQFLAPLVVSLLSTRRDTAPPGLAGGGFGATGAQTLVRADGTTQALEGLFRITVEPGDSLEIETPGGGGWGRPGSPRPRVSASRASGGDEDD